jgi:DNA-binding LacI/PurR family transcriptional regulator
MATIYDIAKLSETSAATVSYVLNGRGEEKRISKPTQEKILAVAQRLNYRPNVTARQLKTTPNPSIRIAAFWPEFYFEQSMVSAMRAIKNVSQLSPEDVEVSVHYFTPDRLADVWDKMSPVGYNGMILAGASMEDLAHIAARPRLVPVVLANRRYKGLPCVTVDHEAAGRMACDLSVSRGGASVCSIWDSRFHVATNLRRTGFMERAKELEVELSDGQFVCEGSSEDGYELGRSLVQKGQLKKVAYVNNESVCRGLLTALNEAGVQVGKEVFLLSANNGPDAFCRYMTPSVTEIDLRMREVFEQGLKLLLGIINRHEADDSVTIISPRVIYRDSMPEITK